MYYFIFYSCNKQPIITEFLANNIGLVRRKKPKHGGVYGNFFHELAEPIKKLVMERVKENKKRIQKEGYLTPRSLDKIKKKMMKKQSRDGKIRVV